MRGSSIPAAAPERIARLITTILVSLLKKVRFYRYTYEELTFGSESSPPRPYRDIINMYVSAEDQADSSQ